MSAQRNFSRYFTASADKVFSYHSVSEFLAHRAHSGISHIEYSEGAIDLMLIQRNSPNFVVMFHAAANPITTTLPVFVGQRITQELDASVLFCSDPALDSKIPIGWFAGANNWPLQSDLTTIIQHVGNSVGAQHFIFQGASAGGFAALFYSHQFTDSLAVAINPQTAIERYHREQVQLYYDACWAGKPPSPEDAETDIIGLYQRSFPNYVLYVQNEGDDFHITNHYSPWLSAFCPLVGQRWATFLGNWGEGHAAPPPFLQEATLQYALSFDGEWARFIQDEEFNGIRADDLT